MTTKKSRMIFFFIKFSGSQIFFEKRLATFSNNIDIYIRNYWLNCYLLWSSIAPGAPFIGDTSLTHVMMLAAHSTKPPTPTTMVQYFILYYYITCILSRIPPPPGGTAILPEYIHYYG
jgi:hypothetical protein